MFKYIIKRLFISVITAWVVITITFLIMHAVPGGPFDKEKTVPKEVKAQLEARYNLNKPLWWQYMDYMKNLVQGDLGPSFTYQGRTVNDLISDGLPVTASLGLVAFCVSILLGIPMGIIAALKQGKWQDNLIIFIATIGITVPSFVIASLLMFVFCLKLGWFPTMRWGTWKHFVLPVTALSAIDIAYISRLTRSSLLEVIRQDYVRTARAKGIPEKVVVYKHALKNALIPVITYLGPLLAGILCGSFVIERIFSIPGIGRQFVESIDSRDYTSILGFTIFSSVLLIVFNFIVDILYAVIDPRIKLDN